MNSSDLPSLKFSLIFKSKPSAFLFSSGSVSGISNVNTSASFLGGGGSVGD